MSHSYLPEQIKEPLIQHRQRDSNRSLAFSYKAKIMINLDLSLNSEVKVIKDITNLTCVCCYSNGLPVTIQPPYLQTFLNKINSICHGIWYFSSPNKSHTIKFRTKIKIPTKFLTEKGQTTKIIQYFVGKIQKLIPKLTKQLTAFGVTKNPYQHKKQKKEKQLEMRKQFVSSLVSTKPNLRFGCQQPQQMPFQGEINIPNFQEELDALDWEEIKKKNTYFTVYKKEMELCGSNSKKNYAIKKVNGEPHSSTYQIGKMKMKRQWENIRKLKGCSFVKYWKQQQQNNFLAMQYTPHNLTDHIYSNISDLKSSLKIFDKILHGVSELQESGIIHRDLKPDNILIDQTNSEYQLKIIDFAESIEIGCQQNNDNNYLDQTFPYSPFECCIINKQINEKTDIWSCGVILHQMFISQVPIYQSFYESETLKGLASGEFQVPLNFIKKKGVYSIDFFVKVLISLSVKYPQRERISIEQFRNAIHTLTKFVQTYD